ncbi:Transportin-3 [Trichinella spiralis]|uniref:Transportin-3 n=1 Tax=Trichinella spiralis TaxID=6334 RepID=A0A0V1B6K6_TRISP|nr:Transportin-3 [Trichinella spiralis]
MYVSYNLNHLNEKYPNKEQHKAIHHELTLLFTLCKILFDQALLFAVSTSWPVISSHVSLRQNKNVVRIVFVHLHGRMPYSHPTLQSGFYPPQTLIILINKNNNLLNNCIPSKTIMKKFLLRMTTLIQELLHSYFKYVGSQMAAFKAANCVWHARGSLLRMFLIVEMDVDSLVTNVICAVRTMSAGSNVEEIRSATNWLNEFQQSDMAVAVAEKILNNDALPAAWTFAATTIRTKLLKNFQQASSESYSVFFDSLATLLIKFYAMGMKPVVATLSSAIAVLHIRVQDWKDPVLDLSSKLVTGNQHLLFLSVLSTYAEELSNDRLRVGICRRQELKQAMHLQMNNVMQCITSIFAMNGTVRECLAAQHCALQCLSHLIGPIFPPNEVIQYPLFGTILEILKDQSADAAIHECAAECASNFLLEIADMQYKPSFSLQHYKHIILELFELLPMLSTAVTEKDERKIQSYVKLFVELSESCITTMITEADPDIGKKPVTLMLDIFTFKDYQLILKTFSFWYLLSEAVYKMNDHCNIEEEIYKYVSELMNLCRYEEDMLIIPYGGEFEDFRFMARESIRDVTFMVGSINLLKKIYKKLTSCGDDWRKVEACMYVLSSVSGISPFTLHLYCREHFEQTGEVFSSITTMPPDIHPCLIRAALDFVICSYKWLCYNPEYYDATFKFVLACFNIPKLQNMASGAVVYLSDQRSAVVFLDDLINILKNAFRSEASSKITSRLIGAVMNIMKASAFERLKPTMIELISDQVNRLTDVMRVASADNCIPRRAVYYLDNISIFFRSVKLQVDKDDYHPFFPICTQLCPLLLEICEAAAGDYSISEHACRGLRHIFRCLGRTALVFLEPVTIKVYVPIFDLIYTMYQKTGYSCYMYMASILTDQFGEHPEFRSGLQQLFNAMIPIAFQQLSKKNFSDDCSETLDDLFRFVHRYFVCFPDAFASVQLQEVMIKLVIATSNINTDVSFRSMCVFVRTLFEFVSNDKDAKEFKERKEEDVKIINAYVMKFGFELVFTLLKAAIMHIEHSISEAVGEVLYVIAKYNHDLFVSWLKQSIQCFANENAEMTEHLEDIGAELAQVTGRGDYVNCVSCLADLYPGENAVDETLDLNVALTMNSTTVDEDDLSEQQSTNIRQVRRQWQEVEDFSLAQRLQDEEFNRHYNLNRGERQIIGTDLRLSKKEQEIEEHEYWKRRHEQESNDEQYARQLHQQLMLEQSRDQLLLEARDEEIAKRLMESEERNNSLPMAMKSEQEKSDYLMALRLDAVERSAHTVETPQSKSSCDGATNSSAEEVASLAPICGVEKEEETVQQFKDAKVQKKMNIFKQKLFK